MKVETVNNYYNDENTYIVYDENTRSAVVIDPGIECDVILKAANDENVIIKYILITHCHYDHILGLEELRKKTLCPLVSGKNGSVNIGDPDINHSMSALGYDIRAKESDIILDDNGEIDVDSLKIKCIYTPGHTNCGVCYLFNGEKLFSGDTLFQRSIGRSDLPTGDGDQLLKTIKEKIYTLGDEIEVYPGHGAMTYIGYEKKFNLFVRG